MACGANIIDRTFYIIPPATIDDAALNSSSVPETDNPDWSAVTAYSVGDTVQVTTPNVHKNYECLVAHTNQYPPDNTTGTTPYWLELGPTNRWAMFDNTTGNITSYANDIDVSISVNAGVTNAIALFGLSGDTLTIEAYDGATLVYSYTVDLQYREITGWYDFFFAPFLFLDTVIRDDLPANRNMRIEISITATSAGATCSQVVIGRKIDLAATVWGTSVRIIDFSRKELDNFGNWTLIQRKSLNSVDFDIDVETEYVSALQSALKTYRATPVVYHGSDDYQSINIWGILKDMDIVISSPTISKATVQVEELA